jgi:hypothetical protein
MSSAQDPVAFRLALNRALQGTGIVVGFRTITPTDVWILAWRINGTALMRILHVALDADAPDLVNQVAAIIRRDFEDHR